MRNIANQKGIKQSRLSVPLTVIGPYVIIGFKDKNTTGVTIEKAISAYLEKDPTLFSQEDQEWLAAENIVIPWVGKLQ